VWCKKFNPEPGQMHTNLETTKEAKEVLETVLTEVQIEHEEEK
jgi:hypothetical protein